MAEQSRIAWTRSTFNPWIGCTKVSPGCDHCYASVSTPVRTLGVNWGAGQPRRRTSQSNWLKPVTWNKRAQQSGEFWPVFCSSLADVFDNEVPASWRADLFKLIEQTPYLTWLLLTKRIGNAQAMIGHYLMEHATKLPLNEPFPDTWPNVWLGATIINQEEADRDIPKLLAVPAAKRFVSYEPALSAVDWSNWLASCPKEYETATSHFDPAEYDVNDCAGCGGARTEHHGLDWIIVGGESDQPGMKARPFNVTWARNTVDQCKAAGVAAFVKQLGSAPYWDRVNGCGVWAPHVGFVAQAMGYDIRLRDRAGADPAEWPEDLSVQEFPR